MGLFERLGVANSGNATIDWDITPAYSFTFFESWGSQRSIRSLTERYYYFFIDRWQEPAKVCLMERGIKYARVLAEIAAPRELIAACIARQGNIAGVDKSYAVDEPLKQWLMDNVIDSTDDTYVIPVESGIEIKTLESGLPAKDAPVPAGITKITLNAAPLDLTEDELPSIIIKHNFFDSRYNPEGSFSSYLVDNNDALTVTDLATGLMWQRGGIELGSIRGVNTAIKGLNVGNFAGYSDWRLPTIEEIESIMLPRKSATGLHLHPCFSRLQPFIFLAGQRLPGGYWFADLKQGNIFWASGFNPGGYGRVCRNIGSD